MAAKPDTLRERASKQATDWLILLQDDPDDADLRRRFDVWLAENPVHAEAWAATQHTADLIATTPPTHAEKWTPFVTEARGGEPPRAAAPRLVSPASLPRRERPGSRIRRGRPPILQRRTALRFAAVAMAACLALVFLPTLLLRVQADHATGTAQTEVVRLDDGSIVRLAADSAIAVTYAPGERRIHLLQGEAFFEVAADPGRPFRVEARTLEATALGTAFDVSMGGDAASVAVEHGIVQVDYAAVEPPVSERLVAGQSVRVAWTGGVVRDDAAAALAGAWRHGQLVAQDQPLGEVVDQLRRYYRGKIVVTDDALAKRPVTGVYNLTDPEDALRGVARAHGAIVRRITPWLLVVSGS